jgi:predicted metal-binding membrane protein
MAGRRPPSSTGALVAGLTGLCAVAWLATAYLATPDMRVGLLTGSATASMAPMAMSSPLALGPFMATWIAMMVAMMVPAVAPVIVALDQWARASSRARASTPVFVAGYFLVWSASGLVAYALLSVLQVWISPETIMALRVGAALLVVAGVYQLVPLKHVCMQHCRAPLALQDQQRTLLTHRRLGPLRVGIIHGLYCLGCCWALMLVLLLLGMMNPAWMAAITTIIVIERVMPRGERVRWLVGFVLVGLGIVLFAAPSSIPGIT